MLYVDEININSDEPVETWPTELRVLILTDTPQQAPFLSPDHHGTMHVWLERLNIALDSYMTASTSDEFYLDCASSLLNTGKPIITLGLPASMALTKANLPHFALPHPEDLESGSESKYMLDNILERCRAYIQAYETFRRTTDEDRQHQTTRRNRASNRKGASKV